MSARKKVEKMLDKYELDELMEDSSIDMSPFVEFFLEELGSENDDDLGDFEDAYAHAIEALEVDEDDEDILWNRTALLLVAGMLDEDTDDYSELYTGLEGQSVVLTGIAFASILEEREEPDWEFLLSLRCYLRDFAETVWRMDDYEEMASEMLWQAMEAARLCADSEDYEQCLEIASAAIDIFNDEVEVEAEGMKEAVGLLWYYMGEGEEDDDTAVEYYHNAIELLDDDEILDDPECEDTPEILEYLKKDYGED